MKLTNGDVLTNGTVYMGDTRLGKIEELNSSIYIMGKE
jgi:hypothetical protein